MNRRVLLASLLSSSAAIALAREGDAPTPKTTFRCGPCALEAKVPERFHLTSEEVAYRLRAVPDIAERYDLSRLTFASPVKTESAKNNTVHCDFFAPRGRKGEGKAGEDARPTKCPAVIVLHVMGGDFELSRAFCHALAYEGVAALFLVMPYYGPRHDPAVPRQMVTGVPSQTVAGMTQAVLDIRRAANWLATQPEIDAARLGIFGISLGGITAALAFAAEPRFERGCFLLAGGDVGRVAWDSPETRKFRPLLEAQGFDQARLTAALRPVDPAAYAAELRGRRVLMLNGKLDDIVPPACTETLRQAIGNPEIIWYDGGHYTAMLNLFNAIVRTQRFFKAP